MSTRAVIAKPVGDGWEGRYHHWDGYPSGLGATLVEWHAKIGPERLIEKLIDSDEAKAGWSTINGCDLTLPSEWGGRGPSGFAARGEDLDQVIRHDGPDCGTEWAYVINENGIAVFERRRGSGESDDSGHGFGMFGFGATDTDRGGYWRFRGLIPTGLVGKMYKLDEDEEE